MNLSGSSFFFEAFAQTGAGSLSETIAQESFSEKVDRLSDWIAARNIAPRDLKLADRQTRLLYYTLFEAVSGTPEFDKISAAVQVAVGPARTELDAMLKWAERILPKEPWPMIQPTGAVGLLPNTPLSWVSIRLGLKGEGAAWSGFLEAGHNALMAGVEALESGASHALVAAVQCPFDYFVEDTFFRGKIFRKNLREAGAALVISPEKAMDGVFVSGSSGKTGKPRLSGIHVFSAETPLHDVFEILERTCSLSVGALSGRPVLEKIDGRNDVSSRFGDLMPAFFPLSVGLVSQQAFGELPVCILAADTSGNIRSVVVQPA